MGLNYGGVEAYTHNTYRSAWACVLGRSASGLFEHLSRFLRHFSDLS